MSYDFPAASYVGQTDPTLPYVWNGDHWRPNKKLYAGRNRVMNGDFLTNTFQNITYPVNFGTAEAFNISRWRQKSNVAIVSGAPTVSWITPGDAPTPFRRCARLSKATTVMDLSLTQWLIPSECRDMIYGDWSLSFSARVTAGVGTITPAITTDPGGTPATTSYAPVNITTTWTRFVVTVPAMANPAALLGVAVTLRCQRAAGGGDVDITGVQFEKGPATDFELISDAVALRRCQCYYQCDLDGILVSEPAGNTVLGQACFNLPTPMWRAPIFFNFWDPINKQVGTVRATNTSGVAAMLNLGAVTQIGCDGVSIECNFQVIGGAPPYYTYQFCYEAYAEY